MSVLIKGMKMPESCFYCEFCCEVYRGGSVKLKCERLDKYIENNPYRMTDCPLVEIPTEHGRLVDADKIIADYVNYGIRHWYDVYDLQDILDEVPVVVPAEKGGAE